MYLQVMNSPFDEKQAELLNQLLPDLTEAQRLWLSGYLGAVAMPHAETAAGIGLAEAPAIKNSPAGNLRQGVTVLYGSQTGNGQALAEGMAENLKAAGFETELAAMSDFKPRGLKKVENLLIIVSTHGEGDPPDNAVSFHEFLHGKRAPKLESLRYAVLSLGDSSYEHFCKTGKDFDSRLESLGAVRLQARADCDLDYDEHAADWFSGVLRELSAAAGGEELNLPTSAVPGVETETSAFSRTNPFYAEVLENINLNGRGSDKETRHLELSLEGSGLSFAPGDSLGIFPENDPAIVDAIIKEMGWDADESVQVGKEKEATLREALLRTYEVGLLTKSVLNQVVELAPDSGLKDLLQAERGDELKAYIEGRDVLDLIRDFSLKGIPATQFLSVLRKLPARLYSIASSYQANPDEVHLTIGTVRYQAHGRERNGVCSVGCAERIAPGDLLPVYVHRNPNFKLPENPDTPVIMIGPGTGVAPFRSFLEEREETRAEGKSWLFFGDRHYVTDFLYQVEWQRWLKDGVLSRLDVAFSRDGEQKVYVQHRMLENAGELYRWLEKGAAVYVCGDEKHMAKDVHGALLQILRQEGGLSEEEASEYLAGMQRDRRYQRDVY